MSAESRSSALVDLLLRGRESRIAELRLVAGLELRPSQPGRALTGPDESRRRLACGFECALRHAETSVATSLKIKLL
jgi:hypothetical protein